MEAEVEEERLRKEREAREKRDVMTLGETREQIQLLETRLTELQDEKHKLFLQLKKVVNEDVHRKRKEAEERFIMHQQQQAQVAQQQQNQVAQQSLQNQSQQQTHPLFLAPNASHQQLMPKVNTQPGFKRQRSPSPNSVTTQHYNKTGSGPGLYIHPSKYFIKKRKRVKFYSLIFFQKSRMVDVMK